MKHTLLAGKRLTMALSLCIMPLAHAATHTFFVDEGITNSVKQIVDAQGTVLQNGDVIKKTGKGTLTAVTAYKDLQLDLLIEEGAYLVNVIATDPTAHAKGGNLVVKDGATIVLVSKSLTGSWNVEFEGSGTGEGDKLGAIVVRFKNADIVLGDGKTVWTMTGDATIYTVNEMNALFSGLSESAGPTLDMNGRTLTIRGKSSGSIFRPRWCWNIVDPGPIVVRNGVFARHKSTNVFSSNIPSVSFTDGASMDTYNEPSLWTYVDAFEFEAGTHLKKSAHGQTNAKMTMKKMTGPVNVSSDATVTISDVFGVRGTDMSNGKYMESVNALTFSDGCALSVTNWGGISLSRGCVYTVASSSSGIVGVPVPTGDASMVFSAVNNGGTLDLTVKSGVIDVVQDWGVLAGEENAAANAAAVAGRAAAVADGTLIYFPAGEYWFADACDFSSMTAKGVVIWNPERSAVLHSGIRIGAAEDVAIKGIVFKGCSGPAVAATGTAGLAISGCSVENVAGAFAGGNYPFAAVNVTDFSVKDCSWKTDSARWDAQCYFEGGTRDPSSEVKEDAIWVDVEAGKVESWEDVTNRLGLKSSAFNGKILFKKGEGTFKPDDQGIADAGIAGVEILQGRYISFSDAHFGKAGGSVRVHSGANLTLSGTGENVKDRTVFVSGSGLNRETPAVLFDGPAVWDKTARVKWVLEDDASMYVSKTGANGIFLMGAIVMNGHHLTLDGIENGNYRIGRSLKWSGGGIVTVKRAILSSSAPSESGAGDNQYTITDGAIPKFYFTDGAKFVPDHHYICSVIKDCDFAAGTSIAPNNSTCLAFTNMSGAPMVTDNLTLLTVEERYVARSEEVLAGTHVTLNGAVAFGEGAKVELDDPNVQVERLVLFSAEGGIAGSPKSGGDTALMWRVFREGSDTLCIGPKIGLRFIVR